MWRRFPDDITLKWRPETAVHHVFVYELDAQNGGK